MPARAPALEPAQAAAPPTSGHKRITFKVVNSVLVTRYVVMPSNLSIHPPPEKRQRGYGKSAECMQETREKFSARRRHERDLSDSS